MNCNNNCYISWYAVRITVITDCTVSSRWNLLDMDWDNSKLIIAKNGSSKPTNDKVMDYYKYPQYLYILAILARSYQTQQDLVSLKEITEIWASLAKILKALQINFS